jgi:hypothetical protein
LIEIIVILWLFFNDNAYYRDRDDKDSKDDDHNNAIVNSDFDDSEGDDDSRKEILRGLILDNLFHKYYHFLCTTDAIPTTIETKINIRLT